MVKNNTGGNKSKKQGRKFAEMPAQEKVRRVEEVGEMYAAITKIFGGTSCKIICIDGVTRDCIIRRKFNSAGGKRQNMLSIGTWVLVGLRDWEVRANAEQKCDLLEVYTASEKERLKQIENNFDFKLLNIASDVSSTNNRSTNIAEQRTKYEDNCDIVTFGTGTMQQQEQDQEEDETSPTTSSLVESTDSSGSGSGSSDEGEDISSTNSIMEEPKLKINDVKKDNDWLIDVDDI